jgi:antitoxin YefM
MDAISYTAARSQLARIMDEVCDNHTPVIITRQNSRSVVLLSLEDYQAIEETAYLLANPYNAERLKRSIAEVESGKVAEKELLE